MKEVRRIEPTISALQPKKKVAAYARVSVDTDDLLHSLSAQVSYYSKLIQENPEWIYAGVYADRGISGTSIKRRSEFRRMVEDAKAGKIDIILTKSISRFARNVVDLLETVRGLKNIGVEVRFERENIHSLTADGELMLTILAGFAEEESRSTSENVKWAIRKKFERGEQWHIASFGYRYKDKTFVIQEDEANAVRKIYDDYLHGIPVALTAGWLKAHGYSCSKDFINAVLRNEAYIGRITLQKFFVENHRSHKPVKNIGQLPRYVIEENHEPIINREVFEEVQQRLQTDEDFKRSFSRPTKKPFGYRWANDKYEIIPEEAEAVKLMYQYYAEGWSLSSISREMEKQGYHTRTGKLSNRIVDRVLDSDFYIGGNQVKGQYAYESEFEHEPIVGRELFDIVQKRRAAVLKQQEKRVETRRRADNEKRNGNPGKRQ